MKKIILVLLFISNFYVTFSQSNEFYKTPQQFPVEFQKISSEFVQWKEQNSEVNNYNFTTIDNSVLMIIKTNPNIQDLDALVKLLTKSSKNDLEKARAFYIWLVNSMNYNVQIRENYTILMKQDDNREAEAIYCFKNRKGACVEISSIFYYMCKKSGVRAFTIGGIVKNQSGTKGHAWNAFKYNGNYYFLDATYGLQTKHKYDIYKNSNFIINAEFYKYLYTSLDIYANLNYSLSGTVYSNEKDWGLSSKEYEYSLRIKDSDWVEFNNILMMVDNVFKVKNENEWLKFPIFGYEYFTDANMKNIMSVKEVNNTSNTCSIASFTLLKEKEYKKLSSEERVAYNSSAEEYLPYMIGQYKTKVNDNKSNPDLYNEYKSKLNRLEYDFTYYKLFKK
jgi:hypothetical protein